MLIILAGLPATGKTTIARGIGRALGAVHIRVDTIEQALRRADPRREVGSEGYEVAYALAEENLRLGLVVIADSVNPIEATRRAWLDVASRAAVRVVEVEIVRSDPADHRHHVEARRSDLHGLRLPGWKDVLAREYAPWTRPRLIIDTSGRRAEQSIAEAIAAIG